MAKKVNVKDDMQAAADIQDGLEAFFEKLVAYKVWAIGAVVLLLIVITSIFVVSRQTRSSREASGTAVAEVVASYKAIPEDGEPATIKVAVDALIAKADPLIAENAGEPSMLTLAYLKGIALLRTGDAAGAATVLKGVTGQASESSLALPVALGLARALKAQGDIAGAAGALTTAKTQNPLEGVLVQKMLGDLYNPSFGEATKGKDRAKAIEAYTKAIALVTADGKTPTRGSAEDFYKNELQKRLSLLGASDA